MVDSIFKERLEELKRREAENALLSRQIEESEKKILEIAESMAVGQEALTFLEEVANARRGVMKSRIESVVTEALRMIYGDTYRCELSYAIKNNRSHMMIEMVRDTPAGEVRREPTAGAGGGVSDTISVPMRLMVMLGSGQTDKVCVLDECWKHVDQERVQLVAGFLKVLTERLGIQVIICSHHGEMRDHADRAYQVSEADGCSEIEIL
jgi:DNA repair exonuclease SbcCD ATPase subunit